MSQRHIMIGTPAYDTPCLDYSKSLLATAELFSRVGWIMHGCMIGGLCYVHTARNHIVDAFLKSECSELIFIDSDIGWNPEELLQLCRIERNVIGGAAPYRDGSGGFPVVFKQDSEGHYVGSYLPDSEDALLECSVLPTAMMRIQRGVFGKLVEAKEALLVQDAGRERFSTGINKMYRFFNFETEEKYDPKRDEQYIVEYGEDVTFCHKCTRAGIGLWVDPRMNLRHHGKTFSEGCLAKSLRRPATTEETHVGKSNGIGVPGSTPVPIQTETL